MIIKIKKLYNDAIIPQYAYYGDAGMDIYSYENTLIDPGKTKLIGTGIALEIPEGYEAQLRPKSGLALHYSITVLNSPGTIDQGYRGEIKVIIINHSSDIFHITKGMNIAQLVFSQYCNVELVVADTINKTERGEKSFGSMDED